MEIANKTATYLKIITAVLAIAGVFGALSMQWGQFAKAEDVQEHILIQTKKETQQAQVDAQQDKDIALIKKDVEYIKVAVDETKTDVKEQKDILQRILIEVRK